MARITLSVNGEERQLDAPPETPLLWALRENLQLTGTKYGCGVGMCGACTVHLDGRAVRACRVSLAEIGQRKVTTIEGLAKAGDHGLQKAWVEVQVPQCGYCQSGQIMQAADLLARAPHPKRDDIVQHMNGNICRCGTYPRIVRAIERAAQES